VQSRTPCGTPSIRRRVPAAGLLPRQAVSLGEQKALLEARMKFKWLVIGILFSTLVSSMFCNANAQETKKQDAKDACNEECLKQQARDYRFKLDIFEYWAPIALVGVGLLLTWAQLKSEGRSKKSEEKLFRIISESQKFAEQAQIHATKTHDDMLEKTKNTVDLVNSTLKIAMDEAERGTITLQNIAKSEIRELDTAIRRFIVGFDDATDVETVMIKSSNRIDINKYSDRIGRVENYNMMLSQERRVPLSTYCLFILGIHFQIEQDFDEAIERWASIFDEARLEVVDAAAARTQAAGADQRLKAITYYWLGYLKATIGDFAEAADFFASGRNAFPASFDNKRYSLECARSEVESNFFDAPDAAMSNNLIEKLEALIQEAERGDNNDQKIKKQIFRIKLLQANILLACGVGKEDITYLAKARDNYRHLIDEGQFLIYTRLGWAQACLAIGEGEDEARRLLYDTVRSAVHDNALDRVEPRSKAMRLAIELICCLVRDDAGYRARELRDEILRVLAGVDPRLTVFSPIEKRYLKLEEFKSEVRRLVPAI
jgi:hypothetical protein